MRILGIDLETFSEADIKKAGLYRYAENSEILLFAYAWGDDPVHVVDFAQGEELPEEVLSALWDPEVRKTAYNAAFEIHVINHWLETEGYIDMGEAYMDPAQWYCTMIQGWTLGLPGGLEKVGKVLNMAEDKQKLATGKRLIQYFSKPCKPTKANGGRTRNLPEHDPEKWNLFKEYCGQDVEAERAIRKRLESFMPNETERKLWCLDQDINDRGVLVDWKLVCSAIRIDDAFKAEIMEKAVALTGIENPNSNQQVLKWFTQEEGWTPKTMDKAARADMMEQVKSPRTKKLLEYKDLLGKTSVKKYITMQEARCHDNRLHGMLQFYGASRTGRWAGRMVQVHNLPRNSMEDLEEAREIVRECDYEGLSVLYDHPSDVLSQLIRTAFIAPEGSRFIVADFSAIEARVIAWIAGEKWRMEAFAAGKDIYCASASAMFGVPVVKHGANGELRAKGKIAELACIAEGQTVLTNQGLVPIEKVTLAMKVWDGQEWVSHEGVIERGEKDVLFYAGLCATGDHLVYIKGQSWPVRFDEAASCGAHLVQTGNGRNAIRMGENNFPRKKMEPVMEPLLRADEMHGLRIDSMAKSGKSETGSIQGMPAMLAASADSSLARQTPDSSKATMREPEGQGIPELRSQRDKILLSVRDGSRALDNRESGIAGQVHGTRPDKRQWELRPWKSEICNEGGKLRKQADNSSISLGQETLALCQKRNNKEIIPRKNQGTDYTGSMDSDTREEKKLAGYSKKVKVYDIRNAGPRHRFTVSGCLVHNCGYGGGIGALAAFGADKMGLSEADMDSIIKKWRRASPRIVQMWRDVEDGVRRAIRTREEVKYRHGITFRVEKKILRIRLPSGRCISYINPRVEREDRFNRDSITFDGTIQSSGGWGKEYTWGGKLTENIVQATARDCLGEAMLRLKAAGYSIVMHVHDEVIIEAPAGQGSLEEVCRIMGEQISWAPGLLLTADGYETDETANYYRKD